MSAARTTSRERVRPPLEAADERTYDIALLRRLVPYTKGSRALFVIALLIAPVTALATTAQPALIREAIDAAIAGGSDSRLTDVALWFAAVLGVDFVARFVQVYVLQLGGQRTIATLRRATYERIQRLPLAYLDRTPVGRVVTRVTNDSDALGELFASGAILAIADVLTLIGIVAAMLYIDAYLTLVVFAAIPPLAVAVDFARRRMRDAFREVRGAIAQLNAYLAEQVQGIAVVQAFGREAECLDEYEDINETYRAANYRSIRYDALLYSIVESISAITVALVLWYASVRSGLLDAASSALYVGTVVAFYEYIQRFFVPIRDLSQKYAILQSSLAAAERIFGLLDVRDDDAPDALVGATPAADDDAVLALEDVDFEYRAGHPVLEGVTLRVRRGEKVAIVGATGAGKTTITQLLLRLYDVQGGAVRLRGADVRAIPRSELRASFGVVPQDVYLFSGTVLDNVAAFDPSPDRARAEQALERVGARALVARRGGLDARIDERGANWSAGERQLLAFARALYLDRDIVILDEATANVDSETEARLQAAVDIVLADRTAIVIAHRLSTIRNADRVIVMHKGKIAEEGSHETLLAADGLYARLHRLQFDGGAGGAANTASSEGE